MVPEKKDQTVESLTRSGGIDVWKEWQSKPKRIIDAKQMRPGSVKSYFTSLAKFCDFIADQVEHKVDGFPTISQEMLKSVIAVGPWFLKMCSAVNCLYGHEKWEKQMEEADNAISEVFRVT